MNTVSHFIVVSAMYFESSVALIIILLIILVVMYNLGVQILSANYKVKILHLVIVAFILKQTKNAV